MSTDPRYNWLEVDAYVEERVGARDPDLMRTLRSIADEGLPAINVSLAQAKLLGLLVRISGARRVLEIGTLAGTSTIAMARELPRDGRLISLEFDPRHAAIAEANVAAAGLADRVEIRVGAALDLLPRLEEDHLQSFDLTFLDADKKNNAAYLDAAMRLSRRGATIVVDNVIRGGKVIDASSTDESVLGTRALFDRVAALVAAGRVAATAMQTVGTKGHDGFALIAKT